MPACHAATPHAAEASSTAAGMFMPECTRMCCQPAPLTHTHPPPVRPAPPLLATQLTAEEHFENAEMAFAMENYDQAAKSFRRALDMEPEVRPLSRF